MPQKIRSVIAVHPKTQEVTVSSRSRRQRVRKDPTGLLHEGSVCYVVGDEAHPLVAENDLAPDSLTVTG